MNSPIYSVEAECRDCYKCVRHCPVKAIRVENDHALVTPTDCVQCGRCVSVCRHGAKQVRGDLKRVRNLLLKNSKIRASIAPSIVSEFNGVNPAKLSTALKSLGFAGVHETADGAEKVSREIALMMDSSGPGLHISTACPVAVNLIRRYYPDFNKFLTPVQPPMLAHAKMLKAKYGPGTGVIFIGPCIAKKRDADEHPDLLEASLTFDELREWFRICGVHPETMADDPEFEKSGIGALYPIEGGMNRATLSFVKRDEMDDSFVTVSGIEQIGKQLSSIGDKLFDRPVFLEVLACEGGCVAGPRSMPGSTVEARMEIVSYAGKAGKKTTAVPVEISREWIPDPADHAVFTKEEILSALAKLGKTCPEDELNCGGCGYDSCRGLASAILRGVAEPQMCVSHMRQLAQKKSNALSRALPYGIVVADSSLSIVEANDRFGSMFGESTRLAYEVSPGLHGADLMKIIPFGDMFRGVLASGHEIIRKNVRIEGRIYSLTVFNIEPGSVVGALILDVTDTEIRRQQLIEKSKSVIENTTKTVQEIAYRLGKNSAQSELILNSVMDLFAAEEITDQPGG